MRFLTLVFTLSLCLPGNHTVAQSPGYTLQKDVRIPMRDGKTLRANVSIPGTITKGHVLLIVDCYATVQDPARMYELVTGAGFVSVHVYNRGLGMSEGTFVPFVNDARDNYDVVDWIARQPWCSGQVVMGGGSYLGFAQWAAAKNPHPALKAIAPIAAVAPGIDFPKTNGIFLPYMLRWLNYTTNGVYADAPLFENEQKWMSLFNRAYRHGTAFHAYDSLDRHAVPVFQEMLAHPYADAYWTSSVPATPDEYRAIDMPVLTMTGFFDADQRGAMHYYNNHMRYGAPSAIQKHFLVIGPYTHRGVTSGVVDTVILGQKIEKAARVNMRYLTLGWYKHLLEGQAVPAVLKDRVNCFVLGSGWRHAPDLQTLSPDTVLYYLAPGKKNVHALSARATENKPLSIRFDSRVAADTFDVAELAAKHKTGSWKEPVSENYTHKPQQLIFDSQPLEKDFELIGSPVVKLQLNVETIRDCDLDITLYEVSSGNKSMPLSHQVMRLSYARNPEQGELLREGTPYTFTCNDMDFFGKRIAAGSRIRLTIGVLNSADFQKNYGSGKNVSDQTAHDATIGNLYLQMKKQLASALYLPGRITKEPGRK